MGRYNELVFFMVGMIAMAISFQIANAFSGGNTGMLPPIIAIAVATSAVGLLARHYRKDVVAGPVAAVGAVPLLVYSGFAIWNRYVDVLIVGFVVWGLAKVFWAYYAALKLANQDKASIRFYVLDLLIIFGVTGLAYFRLIGIYFGVFKP